MAGPSPRKVPNFEIKQKLLRPALTSHFRCWFNPPDISDIRKYYLEGGNTISLLCSDASLPGSSVLTNEINDDYTGVTERLGYRRQYDNTTDFTFYVDHATLNGGYNVIRLFEAWIRYAMGETSEAPDANYHYRVRYPDGNTGYRNEMFVQKFERDFLGNYLEYTFVRAYPIAIASMPVSYNASELLKCTVSFTYNRYILKSNANQLGTLPAGIGQQPATGVPNTPNLGDQRILDLMNENRTLTNEELIRLGYSVSSAPEPTIRRSSTNATTNLTGTTSLIDIKGTTNVGSNQYPNLFTPAPTDNTNSSLNINTGSGGIIPSGAPSQGTESELVE
jgi:hypothetical protein